MSYHIYCLNHGDTRTPYITASFEKAGLSDKVTFHPGVSIASIKAANNDLPEVRANQYAGWSITMGHLTMMQDFLQNSQVEYGIFCENDIKIHKDFTDKITYCIESMRELNLEIFLLSYLLDGLWLLEKQYKAGIFDYSFSLCGTQMFMLTRAKCQEYVAKYNLAYLFAAQEKSFLHYAADFILTKDGRKALIYPMLAVEYQVPGWQSHRSQDGDTLFHRSCCKYNLTDDYV